MKSLLVVEACSHPKVLENQYHLFKDKFNITFLVIPDKYGSYQSMMPGILNEGRFLYSFHSTSLFFELLFHGVRYDYIHISTGPEHSHFSTLWTHPLFFLCCLIYRKKIILTIKTSRSFFRRKAFFTNLLHHTIKLIPRLMFETDTLRNYFLKEYQHPFQTAVVYDRYTDLLPSQHAVPPIASSPLKIGLLGSLDETRRNYQLLLEVLESLSAKSRKSFSFAILGQCRDGSDNLILKQLQKYVEVDFPDGFLASDDFDSKGASCHLLLAPLLSHMEYGTYKGTGAIGDAIYLRRNIILPAACDPEGEFKEIAYCYSSKDDLISFFNKLDVLAERVVDSRFVEKFSTSNISSSIIEDLDLQGVHS